MEKDFRTQMERFLTGSMSREERKEFIDLIKSGAFEQELDAAIESAMQKNLYAINDNDEVKELVYRKIAEDIRQQNAEPKLSGNSRKVSVRYWWAAAIVILAAGIWWYAGLSDSSSQQTARQENSPAVLPGTNGAVLTLADGSTILLDSLSDGIVTTQDGIEVRLNDHKLMYDHAAGNNNGALSYNTMSTPRGRQFMLVLPDGTKVWMNAASSIRYPARFGHKTREVQITGELFFEVEKDNSRPFVVSLNDGSKIEVLGTSFNINAYDDEAEINTTLINGAVRIEKDKSNAVVLKALQQAQINRTGPDNNRNEIRLLKDPDIEKVIAWKNGAFDFTNTSLEEMMRQLSRWYNISVEYPQGIPALEFEGKMSRNITLNGLLKILDQSGVHFRLEGNKLVVLP